MDRYADIYRALMAMVRDPILGQRRSPLSNSDGEVLEYDAEEDAFLTYAQRGARAACRRQRRENAAKPPMDRFPLPKEAQAWCDANGYVEPFQNEGQWWAFEGAAVMPVRITELIKTKSGD